MKKIKNILCCILAVAMVITVAVPSTVEAASYKSELKSLQKKTEKQVNKYKKQWQSEKKKYKSQTKGTVTIIGTIESRDPYIVYDSLRKSYYWIENSKYMDSMITSTSGHVKVTGKTKKWNNVTCAVAKAVKVTANPAKYEQLYKDASKKSNEASNEKESNKVLIKDNKSTTRGRSDGGYGSVFGMVLVIVAISFIITALLIKMMS